MRYFQVLVRITFEHVAEYFIVDLIWFHAFAIFILITDYFYLCFFWKNWKLPHFLPTATFEGARMRVWLVHWFDLCKWLFVRLHEQKCVWTICSKLTVSFIGPWCRLIIVHALKFFLFSKITLNSCSIFVHLESHMFLVIIYFWFFYYL